MEKQRIGLTIQEEWSSAAAAAETADLMWVGEEALIDSTQALILPPPVISRVFKRFLVERETKPEPGGTGGFWEAVVAVKMEGGLETAAVIAMLIASVITTFWLAIFMSSMKLTAKTESVFSVFQNKHNQICNFEKERDFRRRIQIFLPIKERMV